MKNSMQCFIVLSEMHCVGLICLFDNITDFLRKYAGPNLCRSSEECDIFNPMEIVT